MKWKIIPKAALGARRQDQGLASERPSHQARPRRSSSSPFLSVLWTSGLALGAAEMHGSTYLWSLSLLFPASGSFNACHDLLERLHEQNRGTNSCLQGLITSELRSNHQPPTMLLDLPSARTTRPPWLRLRFTARGWLCIARRDPKEHLFHAKSKALS
ncbi:hypothetical protein VNO77_27659 [Canavalia gladiata]|uniref:Uncharacterized protein n=1 Tax=Canavalia gladiata TaxID=3824 RepID=A0AAN9Q6P0_CANGL